MVGTLPTGSSHLVQYYYNSVNNKYLSSLQYAARFVLRQSHKQTAAKPPLRVKHNRRYSNIRTYLIASRQPNRVEMTFIIGSHRHTTYLLHLMVENKYAADTSSGRVADEPQNSQTKMPGK